MSGKASVNRIANGLVYDFPDEKSCIPMHTHDEVSHYAYVLSGMFSITCDGGELLAKPGDYIDFPVGEKHCIQPLGRAAVFNRFHSPCDTAQLEGLVQSDLANLRSATMQKSTQNLLMIGGAAALLYYLFVKKGSGVNADMGGKNFGVCPQGGWCCPTGSTYSSNTSAGGGS